MGTLVRFAKVGSADVRVDLCRDEASVPEQFLDAANIRATIQEMCGETMTQRMGRDRLG